MDEPGRCCIVCKMNTTIQLKGRISTNSARQTMQSYRVIANRKFCSYYRCTKNSVCNPEVTFFAFPKARERYEMWVKLAGVSNKLLEDKRYCFLCQIHFPSFYICRSQRRLVLLANALPYSFENTIEPEIESTEEMEIYEMTSEGTLKGLSKERRLEDNDVSDSTDNGRNSETDSEAKRLPAKRLSTPEANIEVDAINDDKETDAKYVPLTDEPKTDSSPRGSDSSRKQYSSASKKAEMNVKVLNTTAAGANAHSKEAESKTVLLNGKTIRLIPINFKNVLNNQSQTIAVGEENTVDAASRSVAESSNIVKSPVSSSTNSFQIVELRQDVAAKSDSLDEKMEKDDKISEFIFKGEEYLQMPKQHFYDKINKLKRSVAYYEGVIKNMRSILDTADPTSSLDC